MKPWIKIAFAIALIAGLAGSGTGLYLLKKKHRDLQKVNPDYTMTAADLQKAFDENEVSASEKYINRIVEVSGIIESLKTGEENVMNITLKTGSSLSSVICTFPGATDTANFIPGSEITIRGECSGYLMDVLLNNCVIIK